MPRRNKDEATLDLFDPAHAPSSARSGQSWPSAERFPLNVDRRTVRQTVLEDLRASAEPLMVAGFAALDELVEAGPCPRRRPGPGRSVVCEIA